MISIEYVPNNILACKITKTYDYITKVEYNNLYPILINVLFILLIFIIKKD